MDIPTTPLRNSRAMLGRLAMALVLAAMVGGIAAASARADDDGWRRDRREREDWREHDRWRRDRRVVVVPPPAYVYAPPPVVYAPPPPSGINLIFPLEIR